MTLDVELAGDDGPLIVALHGIQGTRGAWAGVVSGSTGGTPADERQRGLATDHRLVLPNLRGRAGAERGHGPADYTLEAFAAELANVVRLYVGDQPFVLAGWSLGVSVALQYVLRAMGPRPAGLLLVSGSPWLAGTRWFSGEGDPLLASIAERRQRLGLRAHADDEAVAWTWQAIRDTDQRPRLPEVALPALVLHGRNDGDCPLAHAEMLASGLGAPLLALNGVGHSVLAQAGPWAAEQMRAFATQTLRPH